MAQEINAGLIVDKRVEDVHIATSSVLKVFVVEEIVTTMGIVLIQL